MESAQMLSNFTDEAAVFTGSQTLERSDSDPRPVYLFSAGDHIHRVAARDSVPHIFAGRVQVVKNHTHRVDASTSMTDGIGADEVIRAGKIVKQVGLPVWAGSIVNDVMRTHADLLVTTIEAFGGIPSDEVDPDRFNCLISGRDSFPYVIEPDWRVRDRKLNPLVPPIVDDWKRTPKNHLELAAEKGGLVIRRALVVSGAKAIQATPDIAQGNETIYLGAIEEILAAYDRFASHGHLYLDEQERLIQSTKGEGKSGYDPYDRYLLWLLGRKGIETARGVTRDDMEGLINAVKGGGQQTSFSREDVAEIAAAAARAAVESLPSTARVRSVDLAETPAKPKKERQ